MTRNQIAAAILGIAAAAGYVALPDGTPQCVVETVFMPCEDAVRLHAGDAAADAMGATGSWSGDATLPACSAGETIGIVTAARMIDDNGPHEPMPPTWLPVAPEAVSPVQCGAYSWSSDLPADRVQVIPTASRYPACLVGEVRLDATGDGEFQTPAMAPYVGTCCAPGCRAAGTAEAIAPGGPKFYECGRLHRLFPDTPCGE